MLHAAQSLQGTIANAAVRIVERRPNQSCNGWVILGDSAERRYLLGKEPDLRCLGARLGALFNQWSQGLAILLQGLDFP